MKRFFFIIIPLLSAFIFFSFLSNKVIEDNHEIFLFFDESLDFHNQIIRDLSAELRSNGKRVKSAPFNIDDINNYIMSNPSALYITNQQVQSDLYALKKYEYLSVKVAVTNIDSKLNQLSEREFIEALKYDNMSDEETIKKIQREKIPYGIVSYQNLNLLVKPLSVNNVFPSLDNIKTGKYKSVIRSYIYTIDNHLIEDNPELQFECGTWLDNTFSIIAGGDIMLSRGLKGYIDVYGAKYPFMKIRDEIAKHALAFANLESPISKRGEKFFPNKGIYFKSDPNVLEGLKFCDFDVLSLANNHSLDWGIDAIIDTMNYLTESGIQYTGVGFTRQQALRPVVFNIKGTSIAFICYNEIYPLSLQESGKTMLTLALNDDAAREIRQMKLKYDLVVASVHTGTEYIMKPGIEKQNKMRELIENGVDIVLGHHPHVIQEVEVYKGRLIAYSLGNLIFDQAWSKETSTGLLLEVSFIGEKPLYYLPKIISITNAQAEIIENSEYDERYEYVK